MRENEEKSRVEPLLCCRVDAARCSRVSVFFKDEENMEVGDGRHVEK